MTEKLLDDFSKPAYEDWLSLVEKQLKGVPFEKKLVKKLFEGISVKPLYQKTDNPGLESHANPSGQFPFIRGTRTSGHTLNAWEIAQQLTYPTVEQLNHAVKTDIPRGLSRLPIILDTAGKMGHDPDANFIGDIGNKGLSIFCQQDIAVLLDSIELEELSLQLEPGSAAIPLLSLIFSHFRKKGVSLTKLKATVIQDPLSWLIQSGELDRPITTVYREMAGLITYSKQYTPAFKMIGIDLRPYHEGGGNAVQELAFAIATGAEYIRALTDLECDLKLISENIQFLFSIGGDFFTEIAKFRAIRSLWAQVIKAFGGQAPSQTASLQAHSSQRNKTINDPHVNILRTTTEAFSAVIGGCDIISISPFDEAIGLPDEFSRRVARNLQIIIREECHGHKTIDPSGGSWFVENLTDQLAKGAWHLFQEIEKNGGMLQSLQDGFVQQQISANSQQIKRNISDRKQVIVGTNLYANLEEAPPESTQADLESIGKQRDRKLKIYKDKRVNSPDLSKLNNLSNESETAGEAVFEAAIDAASNGATLGEIQTTLCPDGFKGMTVSPILIRRDSEGYEQLRKNALAFQKRTGAFPKAFLANMGPVSQHKARVDFSIDFLTPGGFSIVTGEGFESSLDAAEASLASKAEIVVICSTDESYPNLVPEFTKTVKERNADLIVLVAGYPKDHLETFKTNGVDDFIHLRADNLQILKTLQEKMGIES